MNTVHRAFSVDCWEGCLRVTGGGIKPEKSFWYLIDHRWDPQAQKWKYCSKEDAPGEITIRLPGKEDRVTLDRYEPHEAKETLGIELAMDGNQTAEIARLRKEAENFADRIRTAKGLDKNAAWESIITQIMATFQYPAAVTQISKSDWEDICAPVFRAGLPRSGYAANFPKEVVYSPKLSRTGSDSPFPFSRTGTLRHPSSSLF